MTRSILVLLVLAAAACGEDERPINVPVVAAGEYETDCQRLCTLTPGDDGCTGKHAEFCLASCRVRTNGLPETCARCMLDRAEPIHSFVGSFGDVSCQASGAAALDGCAEECDDGSTAPPSPALADLCTLECAFYMQDTTPLACSADGSRDCLADCATTIAARGRLCAQCLTEQTIPVRSCINDNCDCEPQYVDDITVFGCDELCDDVAPGV